MKILQLAIQILESFMVYLEPEPREDFSAVDLRIEDLTKQFYIELAARDDIIANLIETASNFNERLGNSQDRIETKSEERYLRKEVPGLVLAAIIEAKSKFDQTEDHATTSYGGTSASSISAMASTEAGFSGTFMTGIETTSSGGTKSSGATTVSDGITSVVTAVTDTGRTAATEIEMTGSGGEDW